MRTKSDIDKIFRTFLSGPWFLLFALLVIAGIVLSAVLRLPMANVDLAVDVTSLQVTANGPLEAQINAALAPESWVYAKHVSVNLGDLGCSAQLSPENVRIQGGSTLSQIVLKVGDGLKVEHSEDGPIIFEFSGGILRLTAMRGLRIFDDNNNDLGCLKNAAGVPIEIRALDAPSADVRRGKVTFTPVWSPESGSLQIRNMPIKGLSFGQEVSGSELLPRFTSTIAEGGKLRVLETDREVVLREGDPVFFDKLVGESREIKIDRRKIHQSAVGHAGSIQVGPKPFSIELCPTYLEYVLKNEKLKAVWIAVIGVIGALWTVRQWAKGVR